MRTGLLDPRNDYVFKRLLADSPGLLTSLINAVRFDLPPIEVVQVLNPLILPQDIEGKTIVLDLLVKDALGRRFGLEMQTRKNPEWRQRGAYYLASTLAQQLDSGQDYSQLRPAVAIHLLDFDLFDAPDQALWRFEMHDHWRACQRYGDDLELNVVEMRKALDLGEPPGSLAAWVAFFQRWNEEDIMDRIDDPGVQEARRKLGEISSNSEEWARAYLRDKAIRDEISWRAWAMRQGRAEGMEEGLERGLEQGLQRGRVEGRVEGRAEGEALLLQRLLTRRFGAATVTEEHLARIRSADPQTLERWADRLLDARSLDDVFGAD